jgi:hypothetical protein
MICTKRFAVNYKIDLKIKEIICGKIKDDYSDQMFYVWVCDC